MASSPVQYSVVPAHPGLLVDLNPATLSSGDLSVIFNAICKRYQQRLFRVAFRIVKNEADAEDVVQESLLRAYTRIEGFRGDAGLYTWLVRIVINSSLMLLRKRSRHPHASLDWHEEDGESWADSLPSSQMTAESEVIQHQLSGILHTAIASLPAEFSVLIAEWINEERTMDELSQRFAITIPATKSRMRRGKQKVMRTVRRRLQI